jgi:antitoxin (DNA-binding transcriptional repressor) of toxin-antitoxin stability system
MKVSIQDLRRHLNRVLKALDKNEHVILTYRDQEKAIIVPKQVVPKIDVKSHPAFGIWRDRKEDIEETLRKGRMNTI